MQLTSPIAMGRSSASTPAQPKVMKEGQLFHGKIVKLHPNQMAEVKIGNERMLARLEVPMKAGDAHYFQVASVSPELKLRVVSGPMEGKQSLGERVQTFIQALKLPQTKEMEAVLRQLIKHEVPATREQLIAAERLIQKIPKSEWLQATRVIQQMLIHDRPMTQDVFRALMSLSMKEPMSQNLQRLAEALMNDRSISTEQKTDILQKIQQIQQPLQQLTVKQLGAQLFQQLLGGKGPQSMQQAAQQLVQAFQLTEGDKPTQLLQTLQSLAQAPASSHSPKVTQLMQQLMQQPLHPMPMRQSEALDLQKLNQVMQRNMNEQVMPEKKDVLRELTTLTTLSSLRESTKGAIRALIQQVIQDDISLKDVKPALIRLLVQQGVQQQTIQPMQEPTTEQRATFMRIFPQLEQLLQQMQRQSPEVVEQLERPLTQQLEGQVVRHALQQVIRQLGFHFEHQLTMSEGPKNAFMETLKPQLLQLLQESTTSLQVRQQAEAMLVRLNAPMMSATEQNGQQQLMMQVPLEMFGKKLDTTLHWEGQTTEDGKIDAKFARVLFYLHLDALDETVVDMQVQNNIVTITVFNDTPRIDQLSKPLEERLKEGLQKQNYRLSGIFFKPIEAQYDQPKQRLKVKPLSTSSKGVDYRI